MAGKSFILMGVCSTGKTSVGTAVAQKFGIKLIDGDDLHPRANILKMGAGQPLNDEDRAPWLERIRDAAFSLEKKSEIGIIVCSALKKKYRDLIRDGNENVKFIWLHGSYELILERMKQRKGHYMKEDMLKSQFATLEEPNIAEEPDVIPVSIDGSFDDVVERCFLALKPFI